MNTFMPSILLSIFLLTACATNPVTGERELSLVSEKQELAIGAQQYAPMRQSQGGDYNVDPALTAYVSEIGQRLAKVSDRKLPYEFKVLNNSIPNAWALPGGKIVINRGLLTELHSEAELAAVLGHEIVHAAARHSAHNMSRGMLLQAAVVGATLATQQKGYANAAQLGSNIGAKLLSQRFSRDAERQADYYGMLYMSRAGYNPQAAVSLQQTFVKLSQGHRQDWLQGMFASHPPSPERVRNNLARLQELPASGEMGIQRFLSKTAHLRKSKPAYDAYDNAQKSLKKGDVKRAQHLVKRAIRLEPKEAHFYAFLGDLQKKSHRNTQALKSYNHATSLNPNFFYYYLQRGKLEQQIRKNQNAEADFKRSVTLLPTADAYYGLGSIARKANRMNEAKQYFAKVAQSPTPLGKTAYGDLVDLDLPTNPNKYLALKLGSLPDGRAAIQIQNPTPRAIQNIMLTVRFINTNGQAQQVNKRVHGRLEAGKSTVLPLGLGALTQQQLSRLKVSVARANVAVQ